MNKKGLNPVARQKRYESRPIGRAQRLILTYLEMVSRTKDKSGTYLSYGTCKYTPRFKHKWAHVSTNRFTRLSSLQGLIRRGLIEACCKGCDGTDCVRITNAGIQFLIEKSLYVP